MTELKPCPFCGGPGQIQRYRTQKIDTFSPGCEACGFWMDPLSWDISWSRRQAVLMWNKRAKVNE